MPQSQANKGPGCIRVTPTTSTLSEAVLLLAASHAPLLGLSSDDCNTSWATCSVVDLLINVVIGLSEVLILNNTALDM